MNKIFYAKNGKSKSPFGTYHQVENIRCQKHLPFQSTTWSLNTLETYYIVKVSIKFV